MRPDGHLPGEAGARHGPGFGKILSDGRMKHHDTRGEIPRSSVTDRELNPFAKQATAFIHLGSMN